MSRQLLDLYTDYLIVSHSQTSSTGLSRMTDETVSHDAITRMLSTTDLSRKDLWQAAKPLIKRVGSVDGVLILDDTIAEKPHSKENEIVAWHFDHTQGRMVKGINILSMLYENGGVRLPIGLQVIEKTETYVDKKSGKTRRRSPQSKNQQAREMLQWASTLRLLFSFVLADSWFASAENMKLIHTTLEKHFVFALKGNRRVALSAKQKEQGEYISACDVQIESGHSVCVYLKELSFALRLARYDFTHEDGKVSTLFLITDQTSMHAPSMLNTYQRRWTVETYHKSLKQNTSLRSSPARRKTTQRTHIFASVFAFIKLESLTIATRNNHFALKKRIYDAALRAAADELHRFKKQDPFFPVFA